MINLIKSTDPVKGGSSPQVGSKQRLVNDPVFRAVVAMSMVEQMLEPSTNELEAIAKEEDRKRERRRRFKQELSELLEANGLVITIQEVGAWVPGRRANWSRTGYATEGYHSNCIRRLNVSKENLEYWLKNNPYSYDSHDARAYNGLTPKKKVLAWAKTISEGKHVDIEYL